MNLNDQIKYEKFGMTHNQLQELRSFLVERMVDNMSTQDLVAYVTDDLDKYFDDLPDAEFIDEAKNYWDCLLYTSPSPRDAHKSRMPSSA